MGEQGRKALDGARQELRPLILSVETATAERSVSVARGAEIVSVVLAEPQETRASSLLGDIDSALSRANVKLSDIELFAVARGPGSFTGLRSGIATVKAFSATLGKPLVGVQTLHALALAAGPVGRVVALIPAGRGEVFSQVLSVGENHSVEELEAVVHLTPEKLLEKALRIEESLCWVGSGVPLIEARLSTAAQQAGIPLRRTSHKGNLTEGREWTIAPRPGGIAPYVSALALATHLRGGAVSADALKAFYVRASDAEIKGQCPLPESPATESRNPQSN